MFSTLLRNVNASLPKVALCIIFLSPMVAAETFYVGGAGANNANPGTAGQPWATLQHAADNVAPGDNVIVRAGTYQGFHMTTSGTAGNQITFSGESGAIINQVNGVTLDGINLELVSYVTIEGFELQGTGNDATSRAGIRVVGDGFSGSADFSQGVIIRDNIASNWGRWGILTGFADDLLIENNVTSGSIDEHGIYVSNSGDRPTIRYNTISNNNANGIHLNGDIFTGNDALPEVDGIISEAMIIGNTIYGNGDAGGSGINGDGLQDSYIANNLLYDNHASGISLYQIDGGGAATGNTIVNNTIINASDARWVINLRNGATGTTIFNNILYNLNTSTFRGAITALEGSEVGLMSDFNLVDSRFQTQEAAAFDLATWQGLGFDLNSQAINLTEMQALFANYAGNNFSLSETSNAIDFGVSMLAGEDAPSDDIELASRPQRSGYDAGAYELGSVISVIFADGFEE